MGIFSKSSKEKLFEYAEKGDATKLKKLLSEKAKDSSFVNSTDDLNQTILFKLIYPHKFDVLKVVLDFNPNVNVTDFQGATALHRAAAYHKQDSQSINSISALLERQANIDAQNKEGNTALHIAASQGDKALVEFLIGKGASINITNIRGQTPADIAMTNEIRQLLVLKTQVQYVQQQPVMYYNTQVPGVVYQQMQPVNIANNNNVRIPLRQDVLTAFNQQNIPLLQQLLNSDLSQVNAVDKQGNTLLHKVFMVKPNSMLLYTILCYKPEIRKNDIGQNQLDVFLSRGFGDYTQLKYAVEVMQKFSGGIDVSKITRQDIKYVLAEMAGVLNTQAVVVNGTNNYVYTNTNSVVPANYVSYNVNDDLMNTSHSSSDNELLNSSGSDLDSAEIGSGEHSGNEDNSPNNSIGNYMATKPGNNQLSDSDIILQKILEINNRARIGTGLGTEAKHITNSIIENDKTDLDQAKKDLSQIKVKMEKYREQAKRDMAELNELAKGKTLNPHASTNLYEFNQEMRDFLDKTIPASISGIDKALPAIDGLKQERGPKGHGPKDGGRRL